MLINRNIFLLSLLSVSAVIWFKIYRKFKQPMQSYGTVIVLNGPSAAGKSSIQKEGRFN